MNVSNLFLFMTDPNDGIIIERITQMYSPWSQVEFRHYCESWKWLVECCELLELLLKLQCGCQVFSQSS